MSSSTRTTPSTCTNKSQPRSAAPSPTAKPRAANDSHPPKTSSTTPAARATNPTNSSTSADNSGDTPELAQASAGPIDPPCSGSSYPSPTRFSGAPGDGMLAHADRPQPHSSARFTHES